MDPNEQANDKPQAEAPSDDATIRPAGDFNPDAFAEDEDVLRAKINAETAQIAWTGVQKFYAQGTAIHVRPELDLVDVGFVIARNNDVQLKAWIDATKVQPVSAAQAREWIDADALMWSVVVRPWVLVQPVLSSDAELLYTDSDRC